MNRQQVIERLQLGRKVEAEAKSDSHGRRVFVEVWPVVAETDGFMEYSDGHVEPLLIRRLPNVNAIQGYRIRSCVLNPGWEQEPDDWDHYLKEQNWTECSSIEELELKLNQVFGLGLLSFQLPGKTESPL